MCLDCFPVAKATPGYLGAYRLLNPVYTSQHCQIWQAYHDGRNGFAAIKTLLEKFRKSREYIGYLKREYAVGSKLVHERIIRIDEFGIDRGTPYLAMEWFPGANLKNRLRQGPEVLRPLLPKIILEATEALAVFNRNGWVHRDVKPENFLVSDEGDVKLIDFSLARRRKGFLSRLFAPRSKIQGTRSYISPEQIRGEPVDERADLYSLGCTMFELLAGRPPFTGANTNELLTKHLRATPPGLETINRDVTPEFAQLVRWAIAKEPASRPHSTEEYYQKIRQTPVFRRPTQISRIAT